MRVTNLLRTFAFTALSLAGTLTTAAQGSVPLAEAEWIMGSTYEAMPRHMMAEGVALPIIRKVITCDGPIEQATLTATALGVYDITVNGVHVEGHELKPGWTDYRKEVTAPTITPPSPISRASHGPKPRRRLPMVRCRHRGD